MDGKNLEEKVIAWMMEIFNAGFLAGFNNSGESYNGEYPFDDKGLSVSEDEKWLEERAKAFSKYMEGLKG